MDKIVVKNFEELVVIVLNQGNVRVVHGSLNCSRPGIWRTREPMEVVIVDKAVYPDVLWWRVIESESGETLAHYRAETAFTAYWQTKEPEQKAELVEMFAEGVTV